MYMGGCDCGECAECQQAGGLSGYLGQAPWWERLLTTGEHIATSVITRNQPQFPVYGPYGGPPSVFPTPTFPTGGGWEEPNIQEVAPPAETNWLPWILGGVALLMFTGRGQNVRRR